MNQYGIWYAGSMPGWVKRVEPSNRQDFYGSYEQASQLLEKMTNIDGFKDSASMGLFSIQAYAHTVQLGQIWMFNNEELYIVVGVNHASSEADSWVMQAVSGAGERCYMHHSYMHHGSRTSGILWTPMPILSSPSVLAEPKVSRFQRIVESE